jgi:dedicated sortase system histidine kinase
LEPAAPRTDARETGIDGLLRRLSRPLIAWLIQDPPGTADPPRTGGSQILEVQDALRGLPRSGLRFSADGQNMILAAAHPIWSGAEVLGAVVVEETTQPIHSLRTRALEGLLLLTLAVLLVGAAVLFGFASRLSWRIRALRDEAESAVDAQGRITRIVTGSRARDEIGDLSRSLTSALAKLGQYHAYLESMAGRLSHELRTPIAVVRSSLENLKLQPLAEDSRVYVARAEDGVRRLATILTRMSEANRLEHSLRTAERERYDLAAVVSGCIDGYRLAYRNRRFSWEAPPQPVTVLGSPDLAAQMLDKLVSNANDFAAPETPIVVSLAVEEERALLAVANQGPTLNDDVLGRLFNSLVSFRATGSADEPHLGLGLYIVRLIAEHHGGSAGIANRSDPPGVTAWVRIPLA